MKRIDPESRLGKFIQHAVMIVAIAGLSVLLLLLAEGCAFSGAAPPFVQHIGYAIGPDAESGCGNAAHPEWCVKGSAISEQAAAAATSIVAEKEARRTAEIETTP